MVTIVVEIVLESPHESAVPFAGACPEDGPPGNHSTVFRRPTSLREWSPTDRTDVMTPVTSHAIRPRTAVALMALALLMFIGGLGGRDLWNPNEPGYGQTVNEMVAANTWGLPILAAQPFSEKPILYFWMARISSAIFGVSEFSLRLPSLIAGFASLFCLFVLVQALTTARQATIACLALALSYSFWWNSRSIQMDILLTACVLGAVTAGVLATERRLSALNAGLLAGVAAGLGFLAKGPVAWVLAALIIAGYWAVNRKLPQRPLVFAAAAFVVAIAIGSSWYLWLAANGHLDFIEASLLTQSYTRFTDAWDHRQPWWYFIPNFWAELAPGAWFILLAIGLPIDAEEEHRLARGAWVWIVLVVLFFSISDSKRTVYVLPAAPAVAILVSSVFIRWRSGALSLVRTRIAKIASVILILVTGIAGAALIAVGERYLADAPTLLPGTFLVVAAAVSGILLFRPPRPEWASAAAAIALVCLYLTVGMALLPAANPLKSGRSFANQLAELRQNGMLLVSFKLWQMRGEYAYYSGEVIPNLNDIAAVVEIWNRQKTGVLLEESALEEALAALPGAAVRIERQTGKRAYLLTRDAPNDD